MLRRKKDIIEQAVISALEKLGWQLIEKGKFIGKSTAKREPDYIVKISGKLYAFDIKYSRNMNNIISTLYYRAVVQLNMFQKNDRRLYMLALFVVDNANKRQVEKLNAMFARYTPDIAWLLIKTSGGMAYKLPAENEKVFFEEWKSERDIEIPKIKLSFSDLELLLFKVLFFLNNKSQRNDTKIKNAYQLSKLADVSSMRANNWVRAMKQSGFIGRDKDGFLILKNLENYLRLWCGKYTWEDNDIRSFEYIQQTQNAQDIVVNKIKQISKYKNKYFITGNYAAQEYQLKFSMAKELQIYSFSEETEEIKKDIGLIPAEGRTSIFLVRAKFPEAVLRGVSFSPMKYLVDAIQLYLDCYHLRERGYEQAEEIKRKLILK